MENLISNIKEVTRSLSITVNDSENDFISLGTYLQNISVNISKLSEQTNKAAGLYQGQDGKIFDDIKKSTGNVLGNLKKTGNKIEKTLIPFESIIKLMFSLNSENSNIEEYSKYLRSLAFNFVIESAIIGDSDENFRIISKEVKELSAKISDASKKIKNDTEKYLEIFNVSHENITGEMNEMDSLTLNSEEIIKNSLSETETLLEHSLSTIEAVNDGSKSVNRELVKIIMAVQLHDSISQRIEHINLGLKDVVKLLGTDEKIGDENYEGEKREAVAFTILKIQSSQLEHIIADLKKVLLENTDAFKGIINEIEYLTDSISNLETNSIKGNLVRNLLVSLERLNKIRIKSNSISDNIHRISTQSSETAQNMYEHSRIVKNIGDETHTKALNSIIASEKLGLEGMTLKVLSQEMGRISSNIRRFVKDVEKVLAEINSNASALTAETFDDEQGANHDEEKISEIIDFLNDTSVKIETDLSATMKSCINLKESMKKSMDDLNFLKKMISDFSAILKDLSELQENFNLKDVDVSDFFSNKYFLKRYTMEKERQIHKESLPVSEENNHSDLNETTEEEYLGDNVDLF